jgi:hypothetical protein
VLFIFSFLDVIDLGGPFVECLCLKFFPWSTDVEFSFCHRWWKTHLGFMSVGFNSLCALS